MTPAHDGAVMTNAADLAAAATTALSSGKSYKGSFERRTIPATWTEHRIAAGAENLVYGATDGEKWIDVNLSKHTMTAYVGAKVVYGPIKMVNGSNLKPTVVGTFHVYLKRASQTMRGSNADGTKYETPDVPYISYFHNGFALHGAPWRSSFGYAGPGAPTAASTCRCPWPSGSTTSRRSAPRWSPTSEPLSVRACGRPNRSANHRREHVGIRPRVHELEPPRRSAARRRVDRGAFDLRRAVGALAAGCRPAGPCAESWRRVSTSRTSLTGSRANSPVSVVPSVTGLVRAAMTAMTSHGSTVAGSWPR